MAKDENINQPSRIPRVIFTVFRILFGQRRRADFQADNDQQVGKGEGGKDVAQADVQAADQAGGPINSQENKHCEYFVMIADGI